MVFSFARLGVDRRGAVALEMPIVFTFIMFSLLFPLADVAIAGFQFISAHQTMRDLGQWLQVPSATGCYRRKHGRHWHLVGECAERWDRNGRHLQQPASLLWHCALLLNTHRVAQILFICDKRDGVTDGADIRAMPWWELHLHAHVLRTLPIGRNHAQLAPVSSWY